MPTNLLDDFSALDGHQDDTAFEALREYTNNGQDLIWTGRPVQGFRLRKKDLLLIPFSLVWAGFAIGWEIATIVMGAGLLFQLWGIPFVLVGLYMLLGRFFHDKWYRARTFYGLTADELVIKRPKKMELLPLHSLRSVEIQEEKNGRGSLSFKLGQTSKKQDFPMVPAMGQTVDSIYNVGEPYRLVRDYKKTARNQSIDMGGF